MNCHLFARIQPKTICSICTFTTGIFKISSRLQHKLLFIIHNPYNLHKSQPFHCAYVFQTFAAVLAIDRQYNFKLAVSLNIRTS